MNFWLISYKCCWINNGCLMSVLSTTSFSLLFSVVWLGESLCEPQGSFVRWMRKRLCIYVGCPGGSQMINIHTNIFQTLFLKEIYKLHYIPSGASSPPSNFIEVLAIWGRRWNTTVSIYINKKNLSDTNAKILNMY